MACGSMGIWHLSIRQGSSRGTWTLNTPLLLLLSFSEVLGFESFCDVCFALEKGEGEGGRVWTI